MADTIDRISRIIGRQANRLGVRASVYANSKSFDVMTEKSGGLVWLRGSTGDAYSAPRKFASDMRSKLNEAWG